MLDLSIKMKAVIAYIKHFWTASLRRQLIFGVVLIHAVLMSIFIYDLGARQETFLHAQSLEQVSSLSKMLAVNSASSVLVNDIVGLEEIMDVQIHFPALRYAMILNPEGRILGHTEADKVGLFLNDSVSANLLKSKIGQVILVNNESSIDVASPIISNQILIGWARINLSHNVHTDYLQTIARDGFIYASLAILIGALFAYLMARHIIRGLNHIVKVAEGVRKGQLKLRTTITGDDEVGQLANDFNTMLDTIYTSKRDLQSVMDNTSAVIYGKNVEGKYIFTNRKWSALFDKKGKGVIGKTDNELFEENLAEKFRAHDLAVLEAGHALTTEEVVPHEDGPHTYISVKFPLLDEHDEVYGLCGISTDITDRIKVEKEKSVLENQLLHSQKMQAIGQLTGGVAHDFNNLLAVILGFTELSRTEFAKGNEKLNHYLNRINTAGIRGRDLVQQMMLYSRKDQSKEHVAPLDISPVLEETVTLLEATFPKEVVITTSIQKNIPLVNSNAGLISQIFMNLCINAKDAVKNKGQVSVTLAEESFESSYCNSCYETISGEYVVITVEDNGEGIEDSVLNRIFEPFFTSRKVGEGTGMGLSVVHGIAHKLGGHIIVNSTVGEGTSFKVLLPRSAEKIKVKHANKEKKVSYDFSDLTVMIVDDEEVIGELLERALKRHKANVKVFAQSEQALAYFETHAKNIDIVVTDQNMPNLSGVDLAEKILAIRPDVEIILCTGLATEEIEDSTQTHGIKTFIRKPIRMDEFCRIINSLK